MNPIRRRSPSRSARGHIYDLSKIFRRLNGLYFDGQVRARLEWGRVISKRARRSREFGAYYYDERLIRIHPVLDQSWVPIHVVESILHHEMCHQVCQEQIVEGRRIIHTAEFRRKEREYSHHEEANAWLDQNLIQLLGPRKIPVPVRVIAKLPRQLRLL